jgi:DNA-binding transcriptional LysR family regulator
VISACQAAGFTPDIGYIVPDMLSRLNLVAAGLGIVVLSAVDAAREYRGSRLSLRPGQRAA